MQEYELLKFEIAMLKSELEPQNGETHQKKTSVAPSHPSIYFVICGDYGTGLLPLSRKSLPGQFVPLGP